MQWGFALAEVREAWTRIPARDPVPRDGLSATEGVARAESGPARL
jgi:hypothetical protein